MNRSEITIVTGVAALSLALSAGCFSSNSASPPGDNDASTQDVTSSSSGSGSEGGSIDVADASPDATLEAGPDAAGSSVEASAEASIEAGPEAGVPDAASEAGLDAGTVAIDTTDTQVITVGNTATLFINDDHEVWSYGSATQVSYQNLPPALNGTVGNDTVNTTTPVTFTLSTTTTCYLLRQDGWTSVDLTGWVVFAQAPYYFSGYDNGGYGAATIYTQTFPAGVYKWNTFSAMYACAE